MGMGEWSRGQIIGRGSSATVSLASAIPSGEFFAVKSAQLSRSALLQREQRILSALDSPNIISYLGFDIAAESSGLCYNLFLEYAPGGSLSDEIKKQGGNLPELTIRSHTREILLGLSYLHSNEIVHCDIKSQNVLIGSDGRAKVADLGCARSSDGDDVEKGQLRGTPMFMAPEVARGEDQGRPADVWAVGCTVIEMATGRPPWPDVSDPITALHRIAFSTDVPESPGWISDEGKDFLDKCLKRDPKERWSADQLLRHPFLANCVRNSSSEKNWTSPKSILDQSFWESLGEEEEEEVEEHRSDGRIGELVGGSGCPDWTWDEEWLTVRINDEDSTAVIELEEEKDEIIGSDSVISATSSSGRSITINSTISTSSSEEFMFCTDHMDGYVNDDCEREGVRICNGDFVIMFGLSNWIFCFGSSWHFPLYLSGLLCFIVGLADEIFKWLAL